MIPFFLCGSPSVANDVEYVSSLLTSVLPRCRIQHGGLLDGSPDDEMCINSDFHDQHDRKLGCYFCAMNLFLVLLFQVLIQLHII